MHIDYMLWPLKKERNYKFHKKTQIKHDSRQTKTVFSCKMHSISLALFTTLNWFVCLFSYFVYTIETVSVLIFTDWPITPSVSASFF